MRIINALLIALLAPMAVVVALRLAPARPAAALVAALFAAVLPGLDLNVTRVGNDALAAVIGGLALVLATRWIGGTWSARRALMLGALLGAAVLVKLTLLGLAPAVATALLWPARPAPARRIALLVLAGAVVAAFLCIWFVINLHLYGVPVPSARTNRLSVVPPMPFDIRFLVFELAFFVVTYWSGEPLGVLPYAEGFVALGVIVALISAVGLVRWRTSGGVIMVALAAIGGMAVVALVLPATAAFQFAGPGRYEYPALPATAALMGLGLVTAMARAFAWRVLGGMYAAGAAVLIVGGTLGIGAGTPPAGDGAPPSSAIVIDTDQAGALSGVQIVIDHVALDRTGHATWLHVEATNAGSDEAEWTPTPTVYSGSGMSTADYVRSTHMPGDLDAGQSTTGWLYVPAEASAGQTLRVVFAGVAADQYREIGDVAIDVPL